MSRGISIRPSQFVFSYGVGSILEAPDGPRLVLDFKDWGGLFRSPKPSLDSYEISDENLKALLDGGRIFRLPTNADLGETDEVVLFRTGRFPNWGLCQEHQILYRLRHNGKTGCPKCNPEKDAQDQAIRFVRACPRGHLDDVDWPSIVHRKNRNCKGEVFKWTEEGSTLSDIKIKCVSCGAEATLSDIYYGTYSCSGRVPESDLIESCDEHASVVLRNASNLRVVVLESVLTIPPRDTRISRILENPRLSSILALSLKKYWDKKELLENLRDIADSVPSLNPVTLAEIENTAEEVLFKTIKEIIMSQQPNIKLSSQEIRCKELDALQTAARLGHPPKPDSTVSDFEVDKDSVIIFPLSQKISLRITPVKRMRVVAAQKGYKRLVGKEPSIRARTRETFLKTGNDRWYLGIDLLGEGIFVDLSPRKILHIEDSTAKDWLSRFENGKNLNYHPIFVWWHTLSHRFIKALALDSGYSSASIRERMYIKYDSPEKVEGAVLLYTSQKGGDGTLGGLIALVPEFKRVISTVLRNLDSCSNDPLCSEQKLSHNRNNGAACYACMFISETSCEFGNSYLDRNLLRQNL